MEKWKNTKKLAKRAIYVEVLKTKVPNWEDEKKRGIFKKNGGFFPNFGKKLINLFIFRT